MFTASLMFLTGLFLFFCLQIWKISTNESEGVDVRRKLTFIIDRVHDRDISDVAKTDVMGKAEYETYIVSRLI